MGSANETTQQNNIFSYWLSPYPECSLWMIYHQQESKEQSSMKTKSSTRIFPQVSEWLNLTAFLNSVQRLSLKEMPLTHCGWMMHIHVYASVNYTIIGSDNGLSPGQHQAIIWINFRILLTGPLRTNFSEILIKNLYVFIQENAFENVVWKFLSWAQCVNSLWTSDAIWRQSSGSTLVQVMAWCLTAPSHYLNQCWLIISKV